MHIQSSQDQWQPSGQKIERLFAQCTNHIPRPFCLSTRILTTPVTTMAAAAWSWVKKM